MQPATPLIAAAPKFPEVARKARLSMVVQVEVTISPSGALTRAALRAGTADHLFLGHVSVQAASRWRFNERYQCPERKATLEFVFRQPFPRGWGAGAIFKPPYVVEIVEEELEVIAIP